jgi:hypothetical protein
MKAASASYMMDGTRLFVALSLALVSSIAGAQSSLPRGLTTVGPAKVQQSAQAMKAACLQRAQQKGETPGAAKEICSAEVPECSAEGQPVGCAYVVRSPVTSGASLGGAQPKKLGGK